jgi:hypothetical protein
MSASLAVCCSCVLCLFQATATDGIISPDQMRAVLRQAGTALRAEPTGIRSTITSDERKIFPSGTEKVWHFRSSEQVVFDGQRTDRQYTVEQETENGAWRVNAKGHGFWDGTRAVHYQGDDVVKPAIGWFSSKPDWATKILGSNTTSARADGMIYDPVQNRWAYVTDLIEESMNKATWHLVRKENGESALTVALDVERAQYRLELSAEPPHFLRRLEYSRSVPYPSSSVSSDSYTMVVEGYRDIGGLHVPGKVRVEQTISAGEDKIVGKIVVERNEIVRNPSLEEWGAFQIHPSADTLFTNDDIGGNLYFKWVGTDFVPFDPGGHKKKEGLDSLILKIPTPETHREK